VGEARGHDAAAGAVADTDGGRWSGSAAWGCIRFRRYLGEPVEPAAWPAGVSLAPFDAGRHARVLHQFFASAFSGGGGDVSAFDSWWPALRTDAGYDPALVFLAVDDASCLIEVA